MDIYIYILMIFLWYFAVDIWLLLYYSAWLLNYYLEVVLVVVDHEV